MLIFVNPLNPVADLKRERQVQSLKFLNSGNQHVRLSDGKACKSEGVECEDLPSKRIYWVRNLAL